MASDVGDSNDGIPVFLEYILHVLVAANFNSWSVSSTSYIGQVQVGV